MAGKLADRIHSERRRQFVGRREELSLFDDLLCSDDSPTVLLHVYGPGGVGKTTLLRQFEAHCVSQGVRFTTLDARNLQPTPESLVAALLFVTGQPSFELALKSMEGHRHVLFVDTYEAIEPLDAWIRGSLIPDLPESALVVLLGRKRPGAGWRSDVWQTLARTISLRNLPGEDVRAFLRALSIPADHHEAILEFTHGYPLALSLVAENFVQRGDVAFVRETSPDMLSLLLERFIEGVSDSQQRELLEMCALARNTTEALIAAAFSEDRAAELFQWLRNLTFIEESPFGLMPHDLARETIAGELRWRNPDRYSELHHRARAYYADRLERASGVTQHAILFDYIYLHRYSPMVQPFFQWHASPGAFLDGARPSDEDAIVRLVNQFEGPESAAIAKKWFALQPEAFLVLRDAEGGKSLKGLITRLRIDSGREYEIDDPAMDGLKRALEQAPLRATEHSLYFRFWAGSEDYQAVSPIQSLIFVAIVQHYFMEPQSASTFIAFSDPDFWAPMFAYALHRRAHEADFSVGSKPYGVFGIDWRAMAPKVWLDRLGEQEVPIKQSGEFRRELTEVVVLSREGFDESVLDALKAFNNHGKLAKSPLLNSRLVIERLKGDADVPEKVQALRALVSEAVQSLNTNAKDSKLFQALQYGYLKPLRSQERAAEKVDVSIATFRRHLKAGHGRLADMLWQKETGL